MQKAKCNICGSEVRTKDLARHEKTAKCKEAKLVKLKYWKEHPFIRTFKMENRPTYLWLIRGQYGT